MGQLLFELMNYLSLLNLNLCLLIEFPNTRTKKKTPINPAVLPVKCIIPEPAKSWYPIFDNQPPPQVHATIIG